MALRIGGAVLAAVVIAAVAWVLIDGGGADGGSATTAAPVATVPVKDKPGEAHAKEPPRGVAGREVEAAVRAYVAAIDSGSGERLCALLAPGALRGVRLADRRGSCAASLDASIGAPAPEGAPSWQHTRVDHFDTIAIGAGKARATLEVFHTFVNRDQPSTEDDIVYLRRQGGGWIVVQPSATLYRALGYPEPPLASISPP